MSTKSGSAPNSSSSPPMYDSFSFSRMATGMERLALLPIRLCALLLAQLPYLLADLLPPPQLILVVKGENSSSASAALPLLLFSRDSRSLANCLSKASSSSSSCPVRLVELALETNQDWPFNSLVSDDIKAPARSSQSESFRSVTVSELRLGSSFPKPRLPLILNGDLDGVS